ncbi:hypothetical protein BC937DRAFT_90668 [Endogone sp. FLAS-F59071]|nr:hypothetical protein BC937DRAFT_90668 [Endogone sp. FLAS-F59071]|eukprot:RUS16903.1 hypothetical protein BC937DRAFT_90668 [Endogone sp. FLAS-F59071]
MRNGRYPWDKANKRNLAVQTEEGLQAITKKFNNAIKKLNTSEVEVRFLSHGVQSTTSSKKDERPEVINPQFGMFSKHWIDANKMVLQESRYLSVNDRLYSRCEHCGIFCSSPAQDYKCPRCTIVVYCSEKCRDDADSICNIFGEQSPDKNGRIDSIHLYQAICWFNHSCKSNCKILGNQILTCRSVQAGEELTISYQDSSSKVIRQSLLYASYGFVCMCSLCKAECGDIDPSMFICENKTQ